VRKRKILKALREARSRGCSCVTRDPREVCGACLASDILGETAIHRRHGFAGRVVALVLRRLREGRALA